eukprot:UN08753
MADLNTQTDNQSDVVRITLISMEGEKAVIAKSQIFHSELLKTLCLGKNQDFELPLRHIRYHTLDRVVRYMKHHDVNNPPKDIEKPLRSPILSEIVSQWDADLVELTIDQVFELLMAAQYLHIKPLMELTSAKIATLFKTNTRSNS